MTEPTVCCVMLTRNRPEYARRAVECFRAQTYENKRLLILDTGHADNEYFGGCAGVQHVWSGLTFKGLTVGALRNEANKKSGDTDILIHFDDDDWSHPNRIAEQVALLQASGTECVGYREMLFWREGEHIVVPDDESKDGEAWLYSVPSASWLLGSSYCYWRKVWERRPFPDLPKMRDGKAIPDSSAEDTIWKREVKCMGVTSLHEIDLPDDRIPYKVQDGEEPRMICRIHGSNTTNYADLLSGKYENTWKRVPEWDAPCRRIME